MKARSTAEDVYNRLKEFEERTGTKYSFEYEVRITGNDESLILSEFDLDEFNLEWLLDELSLPPRIPMRNIRVNFLTCLVQIQFPF